MEVPDVTGSTGVHVTSTEVEYAASLLFFMGLMLLGLVLMFRRGRGKSGGAPPPQAPPQESIKDLDGRANAQLLASDNALKTSEQELGFAIAQYGDAGTKSFTEALAAARADVAEAFRIRQRLDDATAEDEPTHRALLTEIIDRCTAADRRLDAQAEEFEQLRAMQSQIESLVPALNARREQLTSRLPTASSTIQDLQARYADSAVDPIATNVEQAEARLGFAGQQLDRAAAVMAADSGAATIAASGAEQAIGQAAMLLDAVDKTGADLGAASKALATVLANTQAEVAAGQAALQAAGGSGGTDHISLAASVARTEQVITSVRAELAAPRPDPLHAIQRIEAAAAELEHSLGSIRDAAERAQHARALLDQALFGARSTIDAATDFITTRRGAVGTQARTRLAEAQRYLELAVSSSGADPASALDSAQRAQTLAEHAMSAAQADVHQWSSMPGHGYGGQVLIGGGGMQGAVLGGILIDQMLGGGRRGGGMFGGGYRRGGFRIGLLPDQQQTGPGLPGRFGGPGTRSRSTTNNTPN